MAFLYGRDIRPAHIDVEPISDAVIPGAAMAPTVSGPNSNRVAVAARSRPVNLQSLLEEAATVPEHALKETVIEPDVMARAAVPEAGDAVPVVELSAIQPTDARTRIAITRGLQTELARLGCYKGPEDGRWSRALTYSVKSFAAGANINREITGPDYGLLDAARRARGRICAIPVCHSKAGRGCDENVRATKLRDRDDKVRRGGRQNARSKGISEGGQIYVIGEDGSIGAGAPVDNVTGAYSDSNPGENSDFGNGQPAMGLGGPRPQGVVRRKKVSEPKVPRRSHDPVQSIFKHPLGQM